MPPGNLLDKLIEAKLTSHMQRMDDGYASLIIHSHEDAAKMALDVFVNWLENMEEEATSGGCCLDYHIRIWLSEINPKEE